MAAIWPKQLTPASGPIRADKLDGAAEGMGQWGEQTQALVADDLVPPDIMTGLTLFLLSSQKREPGKQKIPGGGGGVAGGVWVRERFTIHRPLTRSEAFIVKGESVGRHVHKGRRYGTNRCQTFNTSGELVGTNVTTGLLAYKVEEGLADTLEGQAPDEIPTPQPDWQAAGANPCLETLKALCKGDEFSGEPVLVGLDLMEARDTKKPDNPIHSDPELAKKAGLEKPIAGGSHVLAFVLELILQHAGRHALLHGASFDVRWKAPVYAGLTILPRVSVSAATADRVVFDIEATLELGATAMVGEVTVPLV